MARTSKAGNYMHPAVTAADIAAELPLLMSVDDAAKALKRSARQVWRWVALGKLQAIYVDSQPMIPRGAVQALLEQAMASPRCGMRAGG